MVVMGIRMVARDWLPKRMFLVLWWVVLLRFLLPFSIPSGWSVYTFVGNHMAIVDRDGEDLEVEKGLELGVQDAQGGAAKAAAAAAAEEERMDVPWGVVWACGALGSLIWMVSAYGRCYREFRMSLPVEDEFVQEWVGARKLRRKVRVRQLDRIGTPLTYGIFCPVILLPKGMDLKDRERLSYILLHEYIHICHWDAAAKMVAAVALCVHWFNPLVWGMYVWFNRDMELVCDECVVRSVEMDVRAAYAQMLIRMEEGKGGWLPYGNYFSYYAVKERIRSIMKIKKTSVYALFAAVLLVASVSVAFVTSASNVQGILDQEDREKLRMLQLDGYQEMSVAEYQEKVWKMTDTREDREFLERISHDEGLYERKDEDEMLIFYFDVLEPLTAERWQTRDFGGCTMSSLEAVSEQAVLEYVMTLTIQDAEYLSVGEYEEAQQGMTKELKTLLQEKKREQLKDRVWMEEILAAEIEELAARWSSQALQIEVEYVYMPLSVQEEQAKETEQVEERRYPHGTEEDYRSLLTLMTPDVKQRSVADFNRDLLAWANENYERMERVNGDAGYDDFAVALDQEEREFVTVSVWFSGQENGRWVQSNYTGRAEEDPWYQESLETKTVPDAWCDLYYQFSYHIVDKETLSVEERDLYVSGMIKAVHQFWEETDLEVCLQMTKQDMVKKLQEIAETCSNEKITVTVSEEDVGYEYMDERRFDKEKL